MIERRYRIAGIVEEPALVRLVLQNDEPVTSIPKIDIPTVLKGDFSKIMTDVAQQAQMKMGRDTICISYEDMEREKYQRGEIIVISVKKI